MQSVEDMEAERRERAEMFSIHPDIFGAPAPLPRKTGSRARKVAAASGPVGEPDERGAPS